MLTERNQYLNLQSNMSMLVFCAKIEHGELYKFLSKRGNLSLHRKNVEFARTKY